MAASEEVLATALKLASATSEACLAGCCTDPEEVVGEANGQERHNAFQWSYTLALPVDGRIVNVQMDDWMYLMTDKVMLNRAAMSKFGIHLGDVTLSFTKRS